MPVRLTGSDAHLRAVGRAAVEALRTAAGAEELFGSLWRLHLRRRQLVSRSGRPVGRAPQSPQAARWERAVWGILVGVGLIGTLVTTVMFAPADRKNAYLDPDLAVEISVVSGTVALAALLIVLVLRVPDGSSARTGEVTTIVVGACAAGIFAFRLIVGIRDDRGLVEGDLVIWRPMTAVIVLLLVGIAIRCDRSRRRSTITPGADAAARSRREFSQSLRRDAARLAASRAGVSEWQRRLQTLDRRGIDADVLAQARAMTPSAWLAWMAYDGEIDVGGVLPRP